MEHRGLVAAAERAIKEVHTDTSVSLQETLEALEHLCDTLCELVEAVEADIEMQD